MKALRAGAFLRDRAECFAFAGLLDAANGFFPRAIESWRYSGLAKTALELGGISAVCWFAFIVIGAIGLEKSQPEPVGRLDAWILGGMVLAAFLPMSMLASAALVVAGLFLFLTSQPLSRSRRLGMMLFALTGTLIWGGLLLRLAPSLLLNVDAYFAGHLAGVQVSGNVMFGRGTAGTVDIAPQCSSIHNISLALILWASLICAFSLRVNAVLLLAGGAAVIAMVIVNITRLAAMAYYYPLHFEFLHTGLGGDLFGLASLLLAGLIIGYGIIIAARTQT